MNDGGNVVVYRSELERMIDQFIWHGGGWKILLALAVIALLAWAIRATAKIRLREKPGGGPWEILTDEPSVRRFIIPFAEASDEKAAMKHNAIPSLGNRWPGKPHITVTQIEVEPDGVSAWRVKVQYGHHE